MKSLAYQRRLRELEEAARIAETIKRELDFSLSSPVLRLDDEGTNFLLRDFVESTLIIGGPGSGKSSTAFRELLRAMLKKQAGIVLCTTKATDARDYLEEIAAAGRLDDVVEITPGGKHRLNILQAAFDQVRGEGGTDQVVKVLSVAADIVEGDGARAEVGEKVWRQASDLLVRSVCDLLRCALEEISLWKIAELVSAAPQTVKKVRELRNLEGWLDSGDIKWNELTSFQQCWVKALRNGRSHAHDVHRNTVDATSLYWESEFVDLPEKTRGSVLFSLRAMIGALLRGDVSDLCTMNSTFSLSELRDGKILLLNIPVREYGESGRVVQAMIKYLAQREVERNSVDPESLERAIGFFVDEAHGLLVDEDVQFYSSCRSARAGTAIASQSLGAFRRRLGPDSLEQLLDCIQTKMLFGCDGEGARWASSQIEEDYKWQATINGDGDISATKVKKAFVEPIEFLRLARGGPEDDYVTQCYAVKPGARWGPEGLHFIKVEFHQKRGGK